MTARPLPDGPLVAWYGDDFTGAAAVMEVLAFAGLPSVLFFDVPGEAQRALFPDARGIGIAGSARARPPRWMDEHLPPVFAFLAALRPAVIHYKVCSTFDSAPHVGSIGRAAEIALAAVPAPWVPLLVAAPPIGRYQAFGTLFAAAADGVHRLDRHPVMARHPVTPMAEADVRRHLAGQTDLPTGLLPLDRMQREGDAEEALAAARAGGARIVALDTVDDRTMCVAGGLIWRHGGTPTLAIGAQGVEYALVRHWQETGLLAEAPSAPVTEPVDRMAVVAGSVSPTTDAQIGWAEDSGFAALRIDPARALGSEGERAAWIGETAERAIASGQSPLVFTARGPDDPAIAAFREAARSAGLAPDAANALLGTALGDILDAILSRTGWTRAAIAGGDTSSHAARRLGIFALTALAATVPGAALCRAYRTDPATDAPAITDAAPLEIALKGGQMGTPDYFGRIRNGGRTTGWRPT